MRTWHFGLRVTSPERSLAFCTGVGYEVVQRARPAMSFRGVDGLPLRSPGL